MDAKELIRRSRRAIGKHIRYALGAGGRNPRSNTPADSRNRCDCSGFVCWALGIDRRTDHPLYTAFNGGWINTDAIVFDARQPTGLFRPALAVEPGVLLVYGSPGRGRYGHIAIVSDVDGQANVRRIIHCASGNFTRHGDAVAETDAAVFNGRRPIFAWYEGVTSTNGFGAPMWSARFG